MSNDLSALIAGSVFGTAATNPAATLLATAYGFGSATGATSTENPVLALQQAEQNQTKDVAQVAGEPQVKRDVAAFQAAIASAKTPQDLVKNHAFLKVLLTASGLASQVPYTALAGKALLSNVSDSKSLANQLSDPAWKTMAQTYDFAGQGLAVISKPTVQATIANAYAEAVWRQSLDQTTPGLSNALTFRAEASKITSVDQILGDATMRTVVTTALGVPAQIAFQPVTAQEQAISSRVNIKQFQDPKFVESFTQRYLIASAQQATSSSGQASLEALAVQAQGLIA